MDRVRFLEHNGQQVLLLDYSDVQDERTMGDMVQQRREIVAKLAGKSLLTLTDVTGAKFTKGSLTKIKEAAVLDLPHLKRAAMVGFDEANKEAFDSIKVFSTRQWRIFPTREEALEWLTSDEANAKREARAS